MTNLSSIVVLLELALQLLSNKATANSTSTRLLVAQAMSLATESLSQSTQTFSTMTPQQAASTANNYVIEPAPRIINPYDGQYYADTAANESIISQINATVPTCAQDSTNLQAVAQIYINQGITDIGILMNKPDYFAAYQVADACRASLVALNQRLTP